MMLDQFLDTKLLGTITHLSSNQYEQVQLDASEELMTTYEKEIGRLLLSIYCGQLSASEWQSITGIAYQLIYDRAVQCKIYEGQGDILAINKDDILISARSIIIHVLSIKSSFPFASIFNKLNLQSQLFYMTPSLIERNIVHSYNGFEVTKRANTRRNYSIMHKCHLGKPNTAAPALSDNIEEIVTRSIREIQHGHVRPIVFNEKNQSDNDINYVAAAAPGHLCVVGVDTLSISNSYYNYTSKYLTRTQKQTLSQAALFKWLFEVCDFRWNEETIEI